MQILTTETVIEIVTATQNDIPALCKLLAVLFTQEQEFRPNINHQQRGLSSIITNPERGCILIAKGAEKTLGMVCLLYTISTALGGQVALLEDMVVEPAYRRLGIGSQLLNHAVMTAGVNHCRRITLLTDQDNLEAQNFYRQQGFALSSMTPMRLLLAE